MKKLCLVEIFSELERKKVPFFRFYAFLKNLSEGICNTQINADVVQSAFENNKTLASFRLVCDADLFGVCTLVSSVTQSCDI